VFCWLYLQTYSTQLLVIIPVVTTADGITINTMTTAKGLSDSENMQP